MINRQDLARGLHDRCSALNAPSLAFLTFLIRQAMCLLMVAAKPGITLRELYETLRFGTALSSGQLRCSPRLGTGTGNRASALSAPRRDTQTEDSACST